MIEWLLTPLSGSPTHDIDPWIAWHARLMVLAWGVLLPLGALAARYLKIAPGQDWPRELDNPMWWHAHRWSQIAGVALAAVAVALAWRAAGPTGTAGLAGRVHAALGWLVMALGALQLAGGWLRGSKGGPTAASMRGDHYDMSPRRRLFEHVHKTLGWLALALALAAIALGLWAADAPRWMPAVLAAWWTLMAAWAWAQQRAGRCIDTYQAIWGPDPRHPGNRIEPIGWGVRRPPPTG